MFCRIHSATLTGIQADIVNVEVDLSMGIPYFAMTGILATEIREAGERVKTAIRNSGYTIPSSRIVVNISPAGIRKAGTALDLPIAVGILADVGVIDRKSLDEYLVLGELSLDGRINSISGVLPSVLEALNNRICKCIVPGRNSSEACLVSGMQVYGADSLADVVLIMKGGMRAKRSAALSDRLREPVHSDKENADYGDIAGQYTAKRMTMAAAAGRHNLLYIGPPGSGKTMLASGIPGILPALSEKEIMEISRIYSAAGLMNGTVGILKKRPFRSPHHSISRTGLYGGGRYPAPGEITLAHGGVLFLDELPLFGMELLEGLRTPMESKSIKIIRNHHAVEFPADFILVAAMNPCKCGFYPDRNRCGCSDAEIARYAGKISRPLWDRFDICVHVERPHYDEISGVKGRGGPDLQALTTSKMKDMVIRAVMIQKERYRQQPFSYNSQLGPEEIEQYCILDGECRGLMREVYESCQLSARGYHKILKVARTMADLDAEETIRINHICEAVACRTMVPGGGKQNG